MYRPCIRDSAGYVRVRESFPARRTTLRGCPPPFFEYLPFGNVRWRHQIENFFARIKEFQAVATRYDKTEESFTAGIHLVAGVIAAT